MIRDVVKRSDLSRSRAARDRHIRSGDETAGGDGNCLHPFAAHLNPWLADLLGRVGMNKRFLCGRGCYLVNSEGHTYLDAIAAYGALPFGYNPRRIWKAILEVRRSGEPSFAQPSLLDAGGELAARLTALAPGGMQFVTLTNSGAESAEVMIKLCRARTGRRGVLSAHSGFHGKTLAALAATGNPDYQEGFGVPGDDFDKVPFGDAAAIRRALSERPGHYAALLLEPVQGEGGIVEAPAEYFAVARSLCDEFGVMLAIDEIQTGLGRTGFVFACKDLGIRADVIALAKALGGGLLPIGAVLYTKDAYSEAFAQALVDIRGECPGLPGRAGDAGPPRAGGWQARPPGAIEWPLPQGAARAAARPIPAPLVRGPRPRLHARLALRGRTARPGARACSPSPPSSSSSPPSSPPTCSMSRGSGSPRRSTGRTSSASSPP